MEIFEINDQEYKGIILQLKNSKLLFMQGSEGSLSCSYLDIEVANRVNEAMAIVTGVKNFEDMLNAKVVKVSNSALAKGVSLEMTGKEALIKMNEL